MPSFYYILNKYQAVLYKNDYYESKRGDDGYFHFLYKVTNIINGRYYIGVHNTADLGDGYKGSGNILAEAFRKYGKKSFQREIMNFFNSAKEAFDAEAQIVNKDLINDPLCYNVSVGGKGAAPNTVLVKDIQTGKNLRIDKGNDLIGVRYISVNKGTKPVFNKKSNKHERITCDEFDPSIHVNMHKGKIVLYNTISNNYEQVDVNDPRRGHTLIHGSINKVTVIDEIGNVYQVDKNHPDYKSGLLKPVASGRWTLRNKMTKECISVPKDSEIDWNLYEFSTCRQKKSENKSLKKGRLIGDKHYKWYDANDTRFLTLDILEMKPKGARTIYMTNSDKTIDIALCESEVQLFREYHTDWTFGHKKYNKINSHGTKNKIWINNGIVNKILYKEDAEKLMSDDHTWKFGCLMKNKK